MYLTVSVSALLKSGTDWYVAVINQYAELFTFGSLHLYFRFHIPLALHIIMNISHLLLVVNSSINFIIYCCVAKRFRKEVKILLALICQKCFKRHETQVMETQLTGLGSQRGSQRSRWEKIDTLCAQIFIFVPKITLINVVTTRTYLFAINLTKWVLNRCPLTL